MMTAFSLLGDLFQAGGNLVDCAGHYGNDMAASVFFNLRIVSEFACRILPTHMPHL